MATQGWGTVRVKRVFMVGSAFPITVFVDGEEAALLGPGDECELKVWAGQRRIDVASGLRGGVRGSLDLDLAAGEHIDLECFPPPGPKLRSSLVLRKPPSSNRIFGQPEPPPA